MRKIAIGLLALMMAVIFGAVGALIAMVLTAALGFVFAEGNIDVTAIVLMVISGVAGGVFGIIFVLEEHRL